MPRSETETAGHSLALPGPARAADAPPARDLQPGEVLAERYSIEAEVGRGGGGIVYKAFDQGAQLWVAVKLLNPAKWSGPQSAEQLYRELRFGRSIQHANVCRIYDVFEAQGRHLLVMEYASAGTLRTTLRDGSGDRPLADKLADARGVIAGLAAIHDAGLVHRDLKPENILRTADGRLLVSDFGLTRFVDQATYTTGLAGTPGYLAPELLSGLRESQASDVWSLGVILHEILEGERPAWLVPPRASASRAHRALDARQAAVAAVGLACRAQDPQRRPASAREVEALLQKKTAAGSAATVRWRRAALALVVGATGAAALLLVGRAGWRTAASPPPERASLDPGTDWSASRLIATLAGSYCLQALPPDRRIVRAVSRLPPAEIDIDAEAGSWVDGPTPGDEGCLARLPGSAAVLFTRPSQGPDRQVMLGPGPDARGAAPLLRGSHPRWLPSGRALVFVTPDQRLAVSNLQGHVRPLAASGPPPFEVRDLAVDTRGERAAALVHHRLPLEEARIEVHDLRTGQPMGSWKLPTPATHTVTFDPVRGTFQFPEQRPPGWVWSELDAGGGIRVVGRVPGRNIDRAVRARHGLLFTMPIESSTGALYRLDRDGSEKYISARARQFRVSPRGDLVYIQVDRSNLGTVLLKRGDGPVVILSEADSYGEPDISSDGRMVVFDHVLTGEIFACDLTGGDHKSRCQLTTVDRGLFRTPGLTLDPEGQTLAYAAHEGGTLGGPLHLRLLALPTRKTRDLTRLDGICGDACQMRWSTPATIRICPGQGATVTEVDVASGSTVTRPLAGPRAAACASPTGDQGHELRKRAAFEFRYVPDLIGAQDR